MGGSPDEGDVAITQPRCRHPQQRGAARGGSDGTGHHPHARPHPARPAPASQRDEPGRSRTATDGGGLRTHRTTRPAGGHRHGHPRRRRGTAHGAGARTGRVLGGVAQRHRRPGHDKSPGDRGPAGPRGHRGGTRTTRQRRHGGMARRPVVGNLRRTRDRRRPPAGRGDRCPPCHHPRRSARPPRAGRHARARVVPTRAAVRPADGPLPRSSHTAVTRSSVSRVLRGLRPGRDQLRRALG